MRNLPIATPKTCQLAIEALKKSAQNNPYSRATFGVCGQVQTIREWHTYSYELIASIEELH